MRPAKSKPYRRSWKNLLLNKRYQLGFTLFMVGLSALLMTLLGFWVLREAKRATEVAINNVEGQRCPPVPEFFRPETGGVIIDEITEMQMAEEAPTADEGEAAAEGEAATGRPRVVLDGSTMRLNTPVTVPPRFVESVIDHYNCDHAHATKMKALEDGYKRILGVLVGVGLMIIVGLGVLGIKMTHRMAGPLYKVQLYFEKMRKGKYDTVHNLRKGDQLVEFYEHFKSAHAGIKTMQREDIEQLRAIIEIAEAHDLASRSPEIAVALDEMRETLARKEQSLE